MLLTPFLCISPRPFLAGNTLLQVWGARAFPGKTLRVLTPPEAAPFSPSAPPARKGSKPPPFKSFPLVRGWSARWRLRTFFLRVVFGPNAHPQPLFSPLRGRTSPQATNKTRQITFQESLLGFPRTVAYDLFTPSHGLGRSPPSYFCF